MVTTPDDRERLFQYSSQTNRIIGGADGIVGNLGSWPIRTVVANQFTGAVTKFSQLQSSLGDFEKCILLKDQFLGFVCQRYSGGKKTIPDFSPGL